MSSEIECDTRISVDGSEKVKSVGAPRENPRGIPGRKRSRDPEKPRGDPGETAGQTSGIEYEKTLGRHREECGRLVSVMIVIK